MMLVGTSQIDITPRPGIELAGFAVRRQPAASVCDPLAVRGCFLKEGAECLLWLHADLLSLDDSLVAEIREWAECDLRIPASRVLLSATHTHSAPAVVTLNYCGAKRSRLHWIAEGEIPASGARGHGQFGTLPNRRRRRRMHFGRRSTPIPFGAYRSCGGAVGLCRADGTFKAVLLSYCMHPVCLCDNQISADWPGETACVLSQALPGGPTVLVSSGACGNIDPPKVGVAPEQMREWGVGVAESVLTKLLATGTTLLPAGKSTLKVASTNLLLPLENWTAAQIHAHADRCHKDSRGHREFAEKFSAAIETWRETMVRQASDRTLEFADVELFAVALGGTVFLAVNGEVFSQFTDVVRRGGHRAVYSVGCANGMIGYIPVAAAYDEGAYEVEWAMLFYNRLRPRRGGMELLAEHAQLLTAGVISDD